MGKSGNAASRVLVVGNLFADLSVPPSRDLNVGGLYVHVAPPQQDSLLEIS